MAFAEGAGLFVWRLLALCGLTVLLSEMAARSGAGLLPFVRRPSPHVMGRALERFGLGLLVGWAVLGFTYLGLALAGLFSPLALVAGGAGLGLLGSAAALVGGLRG